MLPEMTEWNVTPREAVEIQKRLRESVELTPLPSIPTLIAGCDVSMNRFASDGYAGFATMSYPLLVNGEEASAKGPIPFPYVPGLLSFREIPMLLAAWEKVKRKPDLLIVDGAGVAHPRGLGIASHLGLVLNIPTIGCAKSRLYGVHEEPAEVGDAVPLTDPNTGKRIGTVLATKRASKPLFVSAGYRITQDEAVGYVRSCLAGYRLPEPTRRAHLLVNRVRLADAT